MNYNVRYHVARLCFFVLMLFGHACSNCTASDDCHSSVDHSSVITEHEVRDLELFGSIINKSHEGVFSVLDKTYTQAGKKRLKQYLQNPITDVSLIQSRQKQLALLLENSALREEAKTLLARVKAAEDDLLYFINSQEGLAECPIIDTFYFKNEWLKNLNKNSTALSSLHYFKPFGLLFPLAEHMVIHIGIYAIKEKLLDQKAPEVGGHGGRPCSGGVATDDAAIKAVSGAQRVSIKSGSIHEHSHGHSHGGVPCLGHAKAPAGSSLLVKRIYTGLQTAHWGLHLASVRETFQKKKAELALMNQLYKRIAAVKEGLGAINALSNRMHEQGVLSRRAVHSKADPFASIVDTSYFDRSESLGYFSPVGKTLHDYQLLKKNASALQDQIAHMADIDALVSAAEWYREQQVQGAPVCFVNFVPRADQPTVNLQDMWHMGLNPKNAVVNDVALGQGANKLIITGPNKGGKSNYLEALGLNIITGQVWGIAAARKADIAVFDKIVSYKIVASDISKGHSTFVAELQRADECVRTVRSSMPHQSVCLLIDDSLLKSTSQKESLALSHRFFCVLSEHPNSCALIATQHAELTQLEHEMPAAFKNLRIKMHVDAQGNRKSLFKLEDGMADPEDVLSVVNVDHPLSF